MWTGIQSEITVITSSIDAKEKVSQLHTESRAEEIAFQLHIETTKPVHDDLIIESGLHVMATKPVFKDIQSNRVIMTYIELIERFNICTVDMTVVY